MKDFVEKYGPYAVITGASSGIGREIARELYARGLKLILTGRNESRLTELEAELKGSVVVVADLAQPEGWEELVSTMDAHEVGLVVANAGFGSVGEFGKDSLPLELEMLRVNCEVPLKMAHWAAENLLPEGRGGLILVSSILAWQGVPLQGHYGATKAYVQSLGEALNAEWKGKGVDVLIAAPGPVATNFGKRAGMKQAKADQAAEVAREIVEALGRKRTVVPGKLGRMLTGLLATAPRSIRIQIMANVIRGSLPL